MKLITLIVLFGALLSYASEAAAEAAARPVQGAAALISTQATRIEADDTAGVIRFFIKGVEEARLDASGLHVRKDLEYGGILKDTPLTASKTGRQP